MRCFKFAAPGASPNADPGTSAKAALEVFAQEPFTFALKPIAKRLLQSIAAEGASNMQVRAAAFVPVYRQHMDIYARFGVTIVTSACMHSLP